MLPQCALASRLTAREQAKGAAKAPTPLETSRSLESDYDRSLAWVAVWTSSIANMLESGCLLGPGSLQRESLKGMEHTEEFV